MQRAAPSALLLCCRMRAETFLRLGKYSDAFDGFGDAYTQSLRAADADDEVMPFRLLHE